MGTQWVDDDGFRAGIEPLVTDVRDFAGAVIDVGHRNTTGHPAANSPAMREISDESAYAQRSGGWQGPISDTHGLGALTLRAAADCVRTFADAFAAPRPPLYGHLVRARSALEASVICSWLSEPGIAREERVKRGLSEHLYSAVEVRELGLDTNAEEKLAEWIGSATALGWAVTDHNGKSWGPKSRGKPLVDGVGRPPVHQGIAALLTGDATSVIGPVQWSRLSAVSHVTFFGLRWAFLESEIVTNPISGQCHVPMGTDAGHVFQQAVCVLRALRLAAEARFALMGWQDDEWRRAAASVETLERNLVASLRSRFGDGAVQTSPPPHHGAS